MWDKEGRGGELLVLPGEPELVASVPRQGVEVGEEGGLLHVLPQEGLEPPLLLINSPLLLINSWEIPTNL